MLKHLKISSIALGLLALLPAAVLAAGGVSQLSAGTEEQRPKGSDSSIAIAFENDLLAGTAGDRDYTYGLNITFTGSAARHAWLSPAPIERGINQTLNFPFADKSANQHSFELGIYGFTPDEISLETPVTDDRPYASLLYAASYSEWVNPQNNSSWQTSFTLGALGLDLAGDAQNTVHEWIGSNEAKGWHNQISDGGELTAKYTVAHQKLLFIGDSLEIKQTTQGSVGYLTEASYALSFRLGRIRSNWWAFDPELTTYGEKSVINHGKSFTYEHYFWGGFALKARAYNVFLQGQFRDSALTYEYDELNHGLAEAWLGYTFAFTNGYRISYVVRGHSSEVKTGKADRSLLWGGLVLARSF